MPSQKLVEAGAHEAARAVALLLRRASVPVTGIEQLTVEALAARHAPRALAVGFAVSGGLTGRFAVIMSEASARVLATDLVGLGGRGDALGKRALGALTELGNIGASAFLNGVARAVGTACVPSVPALVLDEAAQAVVTALGGGEGALVATLGVGKCTLDLALVRR